MIHGLLFLLGLVLTSIAIPLVKRLSFKIGYLDSPKGDALKIHPLPIPHSGGIAIFAVFVFLFCGFSISEGLLKPESAGLLLGGCTVFALGIWDDLSPTLPFIRFCFQVLAGIILFLLGQRVKAPLWTSLPITIFYVVGAVNAVNMEDGLDGLATGLTLVSYLGFAFIALKSGHLQSLMISVILAGSLIGFLFYNFNPASIFMGSNGSYFIGFMLACLALSFSDFNHWTKFPGPILVIGVPVIDAGYAVLRRLAKGVSPFCGDRSHFYDQLMQAGLSVRQTVLICWGIQAVLVSRGVVVHIMGM